MAERPIDFGTVTRIEADAVGPPGQRRFRLVVFNENLSACLWMEKEQLHALALAIEQVFGELTGNPLRSTLPPSGPVAPLRDLPRRWSVEFTVGRLGLGYDRETNQFLLVAHDTESDPEGEPTFRCQATRPQMKALSQRALALVYAGRPRCPLCGAPLAGGSHVCARMNGHVAHEPEA